MQAGSTLGPYEILAPLGTGGMGEVYRARDTRLGREVAIKVLPAGFADDRERLARFEQEARAAAALNHPHIAAVFDVGVASGEDGSIHYIVQELLAGEPLSKTLERGPVPLPRALGLGAQIADALAAAHRAGVVHRDLKPANVVVSPEGDAKVLDFGLAKLVEIPTAAPSGLTQSPTMLGTMAGAIMGTAGYMAPEQVQGEPVDARADVFALGCVLYEMSTGRSPFAGQSIPDTLSRVLHHEPEPVERSLPRTPAELRRILAKCLAKDRQQRYQHADDLAVDLRTLAADLAAGRAVAPAPVSSEPASRRGVPLPVALVLGVGLLAAGAWIGDRVIRGSGEVAAPAVMRFRLPLQAGSMVVPRSSIAIDPSGRHVVLSVMGESGLLRWSLDSEEPVELRGTAGQDNTPIFSPDGRWLAFWDGETSTLRRVSLQGGPSTEIAGFNAGELHGAAWADDDTILVATGEAIHRVDVESGTVEELIAVASHELAGMPRMFPGSDRVFYTLGEDGSWGTRTVVAETPGGERVRVVENAADARYLLSGHLVYEQEGTLWAVGFDPATLRLSGDPAPMIEGVSRVHDYSPNTGIALAHYDVSANGHLIYLDAASDLTRRLFVLAPDGTVTALDSGLQVQDPRMAPNGRYVAVGADDGFQTEIAVLDLDTGGWTMVTPDMAAKNPIWSHDGEWLYAALNATDDAPGGLWRLSPSFLTPPRRVYETPSDHSGLSPGSVTDDGALMSINTYRGWDGDGRLLDFRQDPPAVIDLLVDPDVYESGLVIHPGGRAVAFESRASGRPQVYVQELTPDLRLGRRWSASGSDAAEPMWSPDGDSLWYRSLDRIYQVPVEVTAAAITVGRAEVRHADYRDIWPADHPEYDVLPDGSILGTRWSSRAEVDRAQASLHLVLNWIEEVGARVRSGH